MLSFGDLSDRHAQLRQVWALGREDTPAELVRDPICHIEPVQLSVKELCQTAVVGLYFRVPLTIRAAAFMTRFSLSMTVLGDPAMQHRCMAGSPKHGRYKSMDKRRYRLSVE